MLIMPVNISTPVTIAGLISTTSKRDLFDYFVSVGPIFVGLLAVWYGGLLAKEQDLQKRYIDVVINMGDKKITALTPLVNLMHMIIGVLDENRIEDAKGNEDFLWNTGYPSYHQQIKKLVDDFENLSRETLIYQSSEMQAFIEGFRLEMTSTLLGPTGVSPIKVLPQRMTELIKSQRVQIILATKLLGLETNRRAMLSLEENNYKKFYKLMSENVTELQAFKISIKPIVENLRKKAGYKT